VYRQGELDSLCGVYSVINSVKAVADTHGVKVTRGQCSDLFRRLCRVLADGGRLSDVLTEGMTITTLQAMTRDAHAWLADEAGLHLRCRRAFRSAPDSLDVYWRKLAGHVADERQGSVLIGLCGRMDHWTCVRSMSDRAIILVDSCGVKILHRNRCTIATPDLRRHHELVPTQALLVSYVSGGRNQT